MLSDSQIHHVESAIIRLFNIDLPLDRDTLSFRQPRTSDEGDVVLPCFKIAQHISKSPDEVAEKLARDLEGSGLFERAEAVRGYVNLFIRSVELFEKALKTTPINFTHSEEGDRIMVEYLSPNTNKPLHLGHLRNGVLGMSLSNVLEAVGHKVVRAILVNDRGIHICKSMLAWERFMPDETPTTTSKKPDHFVGDCYVRYTKEVASDGTLEGEVAAMLQCWEAGDPKTIETWRTMNNWVYDGFRQTFADFGFNFDAWYYESDTYMLGKDIVVEGLQRGVFESLDDEAIVFRLDPELFGVKKDGSGGIAAVLRGDGTSVYLTQDIGTAVIKADEHEIDRSVYIVACEQEHHFRVLFEILKKLGYPWASMCYHLSYEMVILPEGKMKSREGTVVDADTLLDGVTLLAHEELSDRDTPGTLSATEQHRRARVIALAAIKFYLLRYNPQKKVKFDPKQSVSLTGDTGPYCLYTYARARSILKGQSICGHTKDFSVLGTSEERDLAKHFLSLREGIARSAKAYDTSILAHEVLELAKSFNRFYANCPVLRESDMLIRNARMTLVSATSDMLAYALGLLAVEVLDEM